MIYNYHTHTYRCGHASGEIEEYIQRAIECGIKYMGFSDHLPYICSDYLDTVFKVKAGDAAAYCSEIGVLREKYKDKIDIAIGFEMEYFPQDFNKMLKSVIDSGAEYLIMGPHFIAEGNKESSHMLTETKDADRLSNYVDCVVKGIKTKAFTYIAHPDIINFTGDVSIYRKEMRKICIASKEFNIPLEINFLGIRDNRIYPKEYFWEIAGEEQSPVTFGFDAHDADNAFDGTSLEKAKELVCKYNLNYVSKPELILIQQFQL